MTTALLVAVLVDLTWAIVSHADRKRMHREEMAKYAEMLRTFRR